MNALRKYLDKIKPNFEEGGKLHAFRSVFDGFETFLFVPNTTSKSGVNVHDAIDSKRIMIFVVIALLPALLFGMYNIGYQNYAAAGVDGTFWEMFGFGLLAVLPKIIVSYVVGLGIEFIVAQWKHEEIQEGYLEPGILVPKIVPVDCRDSLCFCRNFRQGNFRRYGYEHFQCRFDYPCVPVLCLSYGNERRCLLGG